jgi:hypothetical protein
MPKKKASSIPPKLTEAEQDLFAHMEQGYQLETDSLGAKPILRCLKDDEVIRPLSANLNIVLRWNHIDKAPELHRVSRSNRNGIYRLSSADCDSN